MGNPPTRLLPMWRGISSTWTAQIERIGHGAELFYFGTLAQRSRQTATTLHHLLEGRVGRLNLLDLNLRRPYPPPESIRWSMQQATVLKCNDGELSWLADCFGWRQDLSPASIAARLQDQFSLDVVFWTRGSQGCVWQAGTDQITAKVPQLEQEPDADTVGAGDAAAAALAIGLVAGWPPQKIVHAANLFGAYVASRRGATQPLPDWILAQVLTE
ncbi:MAG: hypothetical protein KatS3mg111_2784 [Pirellulaceae bacterium]|nr:MAG: hypothetical protein KatS3mg111_2784 [Pirellulaceae bacterium]